MARTKQGSGCYPEHERQRISWTRFRLSPGTDWPIWSKVYLDRRLGPLTNVAGCQDVRLGRRLEDLERAVLVIHWVSPEAIEEFQKTSACHDFLQDLGCEPERQNPFLGLRWRVGPLGTYGLSGRVGITILHMQHFGVPDHTSLYSIPSTQSIAFTGLHCPTPGQSLPRRQFSNHLLEAHDRQQGTATVAVSPNHSLCFVLYPWTNLDHRSVENEEAWARDPRTNALRAIEVAKVSPPVLGWDYQRWHFVSRPPREEACSDYDDDSENDHWDPHPTNHFYHHHDDEDDEDDDDNEGSIHWNARWNRALESPDEHTI